MIGCPSPWSVSLLVFDDLLRRDLLEDCASSTDYSRKTKKGISKVLVGMRNWISKRYLEVSLTEWWVSYLWVTVSLSIRRLWGVKSLFCYSLARVLCWFTSLVFNLEHFWLSITLVFVIWTWILLLIIRVWVVLLWITLLRWTTTTHVAWLFSFFNLISLLILVNLVIVCLPGHLICSTTASSTQGTASPSLITVRGFA